MKKSEIHKKKIMFTCSEKKKGWMKKKLIFPEIQFQSVLHFQTDSLHTFDYLLFFSLSKTSSIFAKKLIEKFEMSKTLFL